jgi:hypothetical protein
MKVIDKALILMFNLILMYETLSQFQLFLCNSLLFNGMCDKNDLINVRCMIRSKADFVSLTTSCNCRKIKTIRIQNWHILSKQIFFIHFFRHFRGHMSLSMQWYEDMLRNTGDIQNLK